MARNLLHNPRRPPVGDLQSSWLHARKIHHLTRRDGHDGAMAYNFVAVERDQLYLMAPSVTD